VGIGDWITKRKLTRLIEEDPSFRVTIEGVGFLCPYCTQLVPSGADEKSHTDRVLAHVTGECQSFDGIETRPADPSELDEKRRSLRQYLAVKGNLAANVAWRVFERNGNWYCPYCVQPTGIFYSGKKEDAEKLLGGVLKHLKTCYEYAQHPDRFHTVDEIKSSIGNVQKEKSLSAQVAEKIHSKNPLFLQKNRKDQWICPYCLRAVPSIVMATEVVVRFTVPAQITRHLLYDCPSGMKGEKPNSLAEVMKVVEAEAAAAPKPAAAGGAEAGDTLYFGSLRSELLAIRAEMKQNEELTQSLAKARQVVRKMLPEKIPQPPGYEFACHFQPCSHVGGDFYDFVELGEGRTGVAIGDVSGHGLEAALVMGMTRKALNMRAVKSLDPADVLRKTNADVAPDIEESTFITCFYAIVDTRANIAQMARAGHNFALVYKAATGEVATLKSQGMSLGMSAGPIFDKAINTTTVSLDEGDVFIQYTDGLTEAMNKKKDEFGQARFVESIKKYSQYDADYLVTKVIKDVTEFMAEYPQQDDITMLAIRRKKRGE